MPGLLPDVDPDGLLEYSVVYTDRAINHMSGVFQSVMTDLSATLKQVYNAAAVSIVPGSGTFGMEAVARQYATGKKCLVIRNGFFSFRWTQIFDMGGIPSGSIVLKARKTGSGSQDPFAPAAIDEVIRIIADDFHYRGSGSRSTWYEPDGKGGTFIQTQAGIRCGIRNKFQEMRPGNVNDGSSG